MRLNSDFAYAKIAADLFVEPSADNKRHDFTLAPAQGTMTIAQRRQRRLLAQRNAAALERAPDGADQCVVGERLRQELYGSSLHGSNRHRDVAVPRDKDDRQILSLAADALLHLETVQVR